MGPLARASQGGQHDSAQAGTVALLSLNLLLLAFFILLTALAHFEDHRVEQVVESVNATFRGDVRYTRPDEGVAIGGPTEFAGTPSLFDELERLVRSLLPAVRVDQSAGRGELRIEFSRDFVFVPGGDRLRVSAEIMFDRIAQALLARQGPGFGYEIDLFYGIPASPANDDGQAAAATVAADSLPVMRAVALVQALTDRDLAGERLAAGLLPGQPETVRLVLRLDGGQAAGAAVAPGS